MKLAQIRPSHVLGYNGYLFYLFYFDLIDLFLILLPSTEFSLALSPSWYWYWQRNLNYWPISSSGIWTPTCTGTKMPSREMVRYSLQLYKDQDVPPSKESETLSAVNHPKKYRSFHLIGPPGFQIVLLGEFSIHLYLSWQPLQWWMLWPGEWVYGVEVSPYPWEDILTPSPFFLCLRVLNCKMVLHFAVIYVHDFSTFFCNIFWQFLFVFRIILCNPPKYF